MKENPQGGKGKERRSMIRIGIGTEAETGTIGTGNMIAREAKTRTEIGKGKGITIEIIIGTVVEDIVKEGNMAEMDMMMMMMVIIKGKSMINNLNK